jgi:arginyl-tRNA synthetase
MHKTADSSVASGNQTPLPSEGLGEALSEKEVELIQKMNEFPAAVEQAGKDYSPSGIANYCYELTKVFNQFYHDYSILNEPDADKRAVRLVLAKNVAKIIKSGMSLLGIEVPERM